jgi:membrane protein DedA with SNARE-associated domain/membrane-associated phospholipid phosphatase
MLIINVLMDFITRHSMLAYGAVFLAALSESLAFIGLIVPGTVIMFGVGAVVATGRLGLAPVLLLAAAGAVAGDGISYWLGRHYQEQLRQIWPFNRFPAMLEKAEDFFRRHGGKSVLFGRFVGPVRPVIPLVAGMLGMRPLRFGLVNLFSAMGWAVAYLLPGVFFGASLAVAGAVSTRLAVLIFLLLGFTWVFLRLGRKLLRLVSRQGPIWLAGLQRWIDEGRPASGGMFYLKRLLRRLFLRRQGEEVFFGFLVLALITAVWGFLGVLQDVLAKDPLVLADQSAYHFLQSLRTPWADHVFIAITELGDSFVNICVSGAVLIVLLLKRRLRAAGYWALAIIGGALGVQLIKWLVHLPRPVALYQGASAYGFPSGHATMSVIIYGFFAILVARGLFNTWRWGLFSGVFLIAFIIAVSRLYLGAHWLSDVLGGFFFGTSWSALLGIAYLKRPDEYLPRRLLGLVIVIVLVFAGAWHVSRRFHKDIAFYAPRHNVQVMAKLAWQADGWRALPAWRLDMAGEWEQPLTIQWAGSPDELARYMLTKGWRHPAPLNLRTFLGVLSPATPMEMLPVLPHLHDGRGEVLRLVHAMDGRRWVLRLWVTDTRIPENDAPLFVGTIEVQKIVHLAGLIALERDTGEYDRPLSALGQTLQERFAVKSVSRTKSAVQIAGRPGGLRWQGMVLLVRQALG